jgi:hypothetical protein
VGIAAASRDGLFTIEELEEIGDLLSLKRTMSNFGEHKQPYRIILNETGSDVIEDHFPVLRKLLEIGFELLFARVRPRKSHIRRTISDGSKIRVICHEFEEWLGWDRVVRAIRSNMTSVRKIV